MEGALNRSGGRSAIRVLQVVSKWPSHLHQLELGIFINSVLGHPKSPNGAYPANRRVELKRAIREAWYWLEGAALPIPHPGYLESKTLRVLSRRALKLGEEPDPVRSFGARRLPKQPLHPAIREDVWSHYHGRKFDTAVFEAMKAVEVAVRDAAKLPASGKPQNDRAGKAYEIRVMSHSPYPFNTASCPRLS